MHDGKDTARCAAELISVSLNAGRCSFEWICLHFKAIFRRLAGFERPENSPVEARKTLQWRVFSENGPAGPGAKSREFNVEMQAKTP